MIVKIYGMLWTLIAVMALLLFVTGNFTMLTLVAFGFISFGMIFMGMMGVLPATIVHQHEPQPAKVKPVTVKDDKRIFHSNHLATR